MAVDTKGLVEAGYLDLDAVFDYADWQTLEEITAFTYRCFGDNDDEPGLIKIVMQQASEFGITAYRWIEKTGNHHEFGKTFLSRDKVIEDAKIHAEEFDESLNMDDTISKIVQTRFFGNASEDEIRAICHEATRHQNGYLILPKGTFVGYPISKCWSPDAEYEGEYVFLKASCELAVHAAFMLLRAIYD